jgi:FkbM family methyltransferase
MIDIVKNKINELRLINGCINFVQMGAYDGVSFNDTANLCLDKNDRGVFIEPNLYIFDNLKENKKDYINCDFLNCAIIPNDTFNSNEFYINVDKNKGTSTFIKDITNRGQLFEQHIVETKTVEELLKSINYNINIFFIDCEGYDNDIVKNIFNFYQPDMLFFESWNTKHLNDNIEDLNLTTREEIISFLELNNYKVIFDEKSENILTYKK